LIYQPIAQAALRLERLFPRGPNEKSE